jgi:RNA-directed DNA polymerase
MTPRSHVAHALADTFLAREASVAAMIAGASWALGQPWPWLPALCGALHARTFEHFHSFSRTELAQLILDDPSYEAAWSPALAHPQILHYCVEAPIAAAAPAWLAALALPALATVGELAQWLNVPPAELGWFADQWRASGASAPALQHYHQRWVPKRAGGMRLIEIPKSRLRTMQRKILHQLLDRVPPHVAAHGFRRAHSTLTHAALHTGQACVIRMDLKDFFPSIPAARVHALFATLGYSRSVAGMLARLCTTRTPASAFDSAAVHAALRWDERAVLRSPHLPQGSPCSPALANLCAHRLDMRLAALAATLGARYSRYADDLVFSGGVALARAMARFHAQVGAIAIEEGFTLNMRKTRLMRAATRQRITGIVVNHHPNIARADVDVLKATLTNCARHGPASQNRDARPNWQAYLSGKVAYVQMVNPARGLRLRALFDAIAW